MNSSNERLYVPPPSGLGPLPFSSGVLVGNTFYLSGHIGIDPATKRAPESPEREIELVMEALRGTLAKAQLTLQNLAYVQVFCSDISLFERFNAGYRKYFKENEPFPARAFIGSGPLLLGARFEIQGIAVKP
jgi:2-iminobutanoate/2-iminopropanoate deaminase